MDQDGLVKKMDSLTRIRTTADYQFGYGSGIPLFSEQVEIIFSKRTGKIRYIYLNGTRLVTLRPTDGLFSISIDGAKRLMPHIQSLSCFVIVLDSVSKFIAKGSDVFSGHVVNAHSDIRPQDEVIVMNESGQLLAIGKALLSGSEMINFLKGVAVRVRHGCRTS